MDFKNLSLIELSELISSGKATSEEVYAYFLDRTNAYNEQLNAFNTLPEEWQVASSRLLEKDASVQQLVTSNQQPALPIAVKDAFCEK